MSNFNENLLKASDDAAFLIENLRALKNDGKDQKELARLEEESRQILLDLRRLMKKHGI